MGKRDMMFLEPTSMPSFSAIKMVGSGEGVGFVTEYMAPASGYLAYTEGGLRVEADSAENAANKLVAKLLWAEIKDFVMAAAAKAMTENDAFVAGREAMFAMKEAA